MIQNTLKNKVMQIMNAAVSAREAAGVNLLVLQNGKELLYAESGYADIEHQKPMSRDTIFRLYSMSKPITAAGIMILMERGIIDLFDPVSKYLPGFRNQQVSVSGTLVPVKRETTLQHLLNMTSGLPYGGADAAGQAAEAVFEEIREKLNSDDAISTVEAANRLGSLPLSFHPGDHFMYGTSADILGAVIEVASGMRFGDFLEKELFEPLGMKDTGFFIPESKQERRSCTYELLSDGTLAECQTTHLGISYFMESRPAFESGGAGLVSTLPDYSRFAGMLLNNGSYNGVQILRPATVAYMTGGQLLPWQQEDLNRDWGGLTGYSYGNLLRVMKEPGSAVMLTTKGEYGWDGWLGPYFSNHPDLGLTILVGMQKKDAGTTALTRKLRNIILSSLPADQEE